MNTLAPTLHRFTGRCPPGELISLGAARREIAAPTLHRFTGRCPAQLACASLAGGRIFSWGGPAKKPVPTFLRFAWLRAGLVSLGVGLLAACSNTPPAPEWQTNAQGALNSYTSAYLGGNTAVAEFEFTRTRQEIASTGKLNLVARAEAVRCAVRLASLVVDDCAGFTPLQADAAASERAYVGYLRSKSSFDNTQLGLLPEQHRAIATSKDDSARVATLTAMADPLARLIAAGVLFQQGLLPPAGVNVAVQAASDQGWRRPLLAWLGVQLKLAQTASDAAAQTSIQRRIDLVGAVKP